jgi:hypothetical protein
MSIPSTTCRNCGGTEFYEGDSARTVVIEIAPFTLPPKFHLRVCGTCGILDWFLPEEALKKFKKKHSPKKA